MKPVYIKLFAGLGNQMFQYAYGKYLEKGGISIRYILNRSQSDLLSVFTIPNIDYKKIYAPEGPLKTYRLFLKKFRLKFILKNYNTGFYQDEKYPQALKDFCTANFPLKFSRLSEYVRAPEYEVLKSCNSVSIHIRGGDYLDSGVQNLFSGVCTVQYYKNAIAYIKQTIKSPLFFIFTNDAAYTQNILHDTAISEQEYIFVQNSRFLSDPGFDLFLMSCAKHNIIANSTYSWWAAFLNENTDKIVIAPKHWQNTKSAEADKILPPAWIRISP